MSNRNIKLHATLYWKTARGIVLRRHAIGIHPVLHDRQRRRGLPIGDEVSNGISAM